LNVRFLIGLPSFLQDTTVDRDLAFKSFIGPRGTGKTAFAQMLPSELVGVAKGGGVDEARDRDFAESIIRSFGGPRKLYFYHDLANVAERPTSKLRDDMGVSALLGAVLLRAILGRWYEGKHQPPKMAGCAR
jgi:hypothetical protein